MTELSKTGLTCDELTPLFRPSGVAVVGATDDATRIGGRPLEYLRLFGFEGRVVGVNPRRTSALGFDCVPDIASVGDDIDLFILAIPAASVPAALEAIGQRGNGAAIVFSGGFAEDGPEGQARQAEIVEIATRHRIPLLGPNCLGMVSFHDRSPATFSLSLKALPSFEPGSVAIASQSGAFATSVAVEAAAHGARFSYVIATGNEAVVDFGDVLRFLAEDKNTESVVGYLEGVKDGRNLARGLSDLRRAGKQVTLLKGGRSVLGAASVGGHSALMTGADEAVDATFSRFGAKRVQTFDELVDATIAGSRPGGRGGRRLAIATVSGGAAVYALDACERLNVSLAQLEQGTIEKLTNTLPSFAKIGNPVDVTAQVINQPETLEKTLNLLAADSGVDQVLLFLGGQDDTADVLIPALAATEVAKRGMLALSWLGVPERRRTQALDHGIPTFADPVRFLRAFASGDPQNGGSPASGIDIDVDIDDSAVVRTGASPLVAADFIQGDRPSLDEAQSMTLLGLAGITIPQRARWNLEAAEPAPAVPFPCVVKVIAPFFEHRSREGGVILGVASPDELVAAGEELKRRLDAQILLVAEQVAAGPEIIVSVMRDASFGERAIVGAGGVRANELDDVRTLVPPFTDEYVARELQELRISPQLMETADNVGSMVADAIRRMSSILREQPLLMQLECNPMVVTADGVTAIDALGVGGEREWV